MAQKYKAKNDKQQSSKRALFTALLLVVLIIGASALFSYTKSKNKGTSDNSKSSATDTSVNLSPPTKEEEKETETFKDNLEKPTETKVETENGKKQVSPIITGADESEVNVATVIPGTSCDTRINPTAITIHLIINLIIHCKSGIILIILRQPT
jgi:flagellar basal body-associated protein FliL